MQSPAGHGQHLRLAASPHPTVPLQAACWVVPGGPWGLLGRWSRGGLGVSPAITPYLPCPVVPGGPWGLLSRWSRVGLGISGPERPLLLCSGPTVGPSPQGVPDQVWWGRPVLRAQDTACSRPRVRPTQGRSQGPQGREPQEDWGGHCSGGTLSAP